MVKALEMTPKTNGAKALLTTRGEPRKITDDEAFFQCLSEAAMLETDVATKRAIVATKVQELQRQLSKVISPLEQELVVRKGQIEAYAVKHRERLIPEGKKSLKTDAGVIGFRAGNERLEIIGEDKPGLTSEQKKALEDAAIAKLLADRKGKSAVRKTLSILKDAAKQLGDEILTRCGLKIVAGEERFYFTPAAKKGGVE